MKSQAEEFVLSHYHGALCARERLLFYVKQGSQILGAGFSEEAAWKSAESRHKANCRLPYTECFSKGITNEKN